MKLIFVEFNDEVDAFLNYAEKNNFNVLDFHLVALSLEAQIYLKEHNIKYYNTLKFFDNNSHKNCLLKSDSIVQFMEENIYFKNNPEVINGYKNWYIFCIKHIVNYILWIIEIVSNAIEYFKPDSIIIFDFTNNDYSNCSLNNNERYIGNVCKIIAENSDIPINKINIDLTDISIGYPKPHKDIQSKKPNRNITEKLNSISSKETVLVISTGYNLDLVWKKIKKWNKKIKVIYFHEESISLIEKLKNRFFNDIDFFISHNEIGKKLLYCDIEKDLTHCFNMLNKNEQIFSYENINFWELIKDKILKGINTDVKILVKKSNRLSYLIQNLRPNLSLSYSSRNLTYNFGEICRNSGMYALCISHGTVVPPKNDVEKIVNRNIGKSVILNRYPSVAVQTPWCEKFLKYYKHESTDIYTGPLVFRDNIHIKKSNNEKIIVHAVTLKTRFSIKFWGVETHDEFISSIISLIETVEKINNAKLIIRLHPAYSYILSEEKFKHILPPSNCYTFNCGGSLYDVLSKADFLISFSSTTIEEALLNKIPVLLYDKWDRYKHFNSIELDKDTFKPYPVYYARNERIMRESLPMIIEKGLGNRINDKDWLHYVYPEHYKSNFYEYLNKCFNK